MASVFDELKTGILPKLRRSMIVNSTDLQGKTDVPGPGAEDGYEACKISDALIKAQTTGQWEKVEA